MKLLLFIAILVTEKLFVNHNNINMKKVFTLIVLTIITTQLFSQTSFKVGDKVEAWNVAWYKATILEIGKGQYEGYYKVHYDNFSSASDQYLNASSIRSTKVAEEEAAKNSTANGPRSGRYSMLSYGAGNNPLRIGSFELKGGTYTYYDMANNKLGDGKYTYNAATKQVTWVSGPFNTNGFNGTFEVSRAGKTHTIRLKARTIGTNSTD
jgi:hypothetical protein